MAFHTWTGESNKHQGALRCHSEWSHDVRSNAASSLAAQAAFAQPFRHLPERTVGR